MIDTSDIRRELREAREKNAGEIATKYLQLWLGPRMNKLDDPTAYIALHDVLSEAIYKVIRRTEGP